MDIYIYIYIIGCFRDWPIVLGSIKTAELQPRRV